ncbi:MAG: hypothetical protein WB711_25555 [Terriglobales bacterium]
MDDDIAIQTEHQTEERVLYKGVVEDRIGGTVGVNPHGLPSIADGTGKYPVALHRGNIQTETILNRQPVCPTLATHETSDLNLFLNHFIP